MKKFWVSLCVALALMVSEQVVVSGVYGLTPAQFEMLFAGGNYVAIPQNLDTVIASSGTPVALYGSGGTTKTFASVTIPANTIAPNSVLELEIYCNFLLPNNGGRALIVSIGGQIIGQVFPVATQGGLYAHNAYFVTADLTAGLDTTNSYTQNNMFSYTINLNDVSSPTAGQGAPFAVHANTGTSWKINFTQPQVFQIVGNPQTGDQMQVIGWTLTNHKTSSAPASSYAPSGAWAGWGDSLTYGVGASTTVSATTGPWPQQIAFSARVGIPYVNMGVSGDRCADITQRIISDKIRGKYYNVIYAGGRNDVGSGTLTATVLACQQAAVGNLSATSKYLITTIIPAANEGVGSANWNAIVASNAQTNTSWGTHVADVFSALTSAGTVQINNNLRAITVSTTNSTAVTSGTSTMTVTSPTGIVNGMFVDDATGFIPPQTTVTISGSVVTLSNPTTGTIPITTTINFVSPSEIHMRDAGYAIWASTITTAMTANGF